MGINLLQYSFDDVTTMSNYLLKCANQEELETIIDAHKKRISRWCATEHEPDWRDRDLDIFSRVLLDKESISTICSDYGIVRCTFYNALRYLVFEYRNPQTECDSIWFLPSLTTPVYRELLRKGLYTVSSLKKYFDENEDFTQINGVGLKTAVILMYDLYGKEAADMYFDELEKGSHCSKVLFSTSRGQYRTQNGWGTFEEAHVYRNTKIVEELCLYDSTLVALDVEVKLVDTEKGVKI